MNKLLVTLGVIVLLAACWGTGIMKLIPEDYTEQIAAYQKFAEEQAELEAYGSAIEYYQKILKLSPQVEYYSRIAELYELANKKSTMAKYLAECVEKYPQEKELYQKLIQYHYDYKHYEKAMEFIENYTNIYGREPEMLDKYYACKYRFSVKTQGYEYIGDMFNSNMMVVDEGKKFYLNNRLKKVEKYNLDDLSPNFGGLLGVSVDNHANFIDSAGMKYLDSTTDYDKTWTFSGSLALVEDDGLFGYVNSQFRLVLKGYKNASNFVGSLAAVQTDNGWALINKSGTQIGEVYYDDIKMDEDRIASFNGRYFAKLGDSYIMINSEGEQVGENTFEDAKPFNRGSYAAVKKDGKWGFVNKSNQWVIEPQFEDAESFGNELGAVCVDGKWGFVANNGHIAITPQFDGAKHLNSGFAPVKVDDLWYVLELK